MYIYIYICIYIYIYIYTYIRRCQSPSRSCRTGPARTVSFHNFKSRNFKLSVSNPENKCVAYVSVLSRISNCQSLGRKNKFEILKTYRTSSFQILFCFLTNLGMVAQRVASASPISSGTQAQDPSISWDLDAGQTCRPL